MSSYILGAVLYFIIGYVLSLALGFSGRHVLLAMLIWPFIFLFAIALVIEDVLTYLQRKRLGNERTG